MTFSSIVAIIGGIVTAGCAIAGVIAGIRARKAQEARNEEIRKAEHEARLQRIREANASRIQKAFRFNNRNTNPQTVYPQPVNNEVHYYYHNIPQQQYPSNVQNQYMNQYSGYGGCDYAYGNQSRDNVYPGERAIGNMSKMQLLQRFAPQQNPFQSFGYYNRPQYAYAS